MIYYNKKNNITKITKKFSPSELLNSQKTKKAFVKNYNGGKRNKIDKKYKNYNIGKYFSLGDKDESNVEEIQDGGKYKRSAELNKIIVKTYKIYTKLKDKYFPKDFLFFRRSTITSKISPLTTLTNLPCGNFFWKWRPLNTFFFE